MQNDDQKKHPGEERYYNQGSQTGGYTTQNFGAEPGDQYPQSGGYITRHSGAIVDPTPQPGSYVPQVYTDPSGKLMGPPPKRPNPWKATTLVLSVVTVVLLATSAILVVTRPGGSTKVVVVPTATTASGAQQPTSITATTGTTGATSTPSASTAATPTAPGVSSNNYSAPQPGPGCDTGGGTWTPQGFSNITCGTQLRDTSADTPGYLYFQLPHNGAFSANNEISIAGGSLVNGNFSGYDCLGLAEQDANTGFLVEYCGNGSWSINSISNVGAVVKTLSQGLTSERQSERLSLTLSGTTLSFSVDTENHTVNISPIQPVKTAIMASQSTSPSFVISVSVQNFSYTTLSS